MIKELNTYLNSKTELTNIVDKIVFNRPINDTQPKNYIYFTYTKNKLKEGYKYNIQFNLFCDTFSKLEDLTDKLECLFNPNAKLPEDLKINIPKIWRILLVSQVPFPNENIMVVNYEFFYNFK